MRRSAPKRRPIGIGSHDLTDRNREDSEDEETFQPSLAKEKRKRGEDEVDQQWEVDQDQGWSTAEAFNGDDEDEEEDRTEHDIESGEEKYEEDEHNDNKKRRRQSKNGRESSQTGLTLRDSNSFKSNNQSRDRAKSQQKKRSRK